MLSRKKILATLKIQERREGKTQNLANLRFFLGVIKMASQWQAFVDVKFVPREEGSKSSYPAYKFYYCSPELTKILENPYQPINPNHTNR